MKQYITKEQLNELSDNQRKRLRDWWKPAGGDLVYGTDWFNKPSLHVAVIQNDALFIGYDIKIEQFDKDLSLPLLSIGQMIEFLDEKDNGLIIDLTVDRGKVEGNAYLNRNTSTKDPKEFCDALWEAVKELLDKEG